MNSTGYGMHVLSAKRSSFFKPVMVTIS